MHIRTGLDTLRSNLANPTSCQSHKQSNCLLPPPNRAKRAAFSTAKAILQTIPPHDNDPRLPPSPQIHREYQNPYSREVRSLREAKAAARAAADARREWCLDTTPPPRTEASESECIANRAQAAAKEKHTNPMRPKQAPQTTTDRKVRASLREVQQTFSFQPLAQPRGFCQATKPNPMRNRKNINLLPEAHCSVYTTRRSKKDPRPAADNPTAAQLESRSDSA